MTELMKQYEKETGHNAFLTYGITQAICYPTYVEWLEEKLTWRPVSEKPEKDGDYFAKSDTSNEPFVLSYKDGIWFFYDYDIGEKVMTSPPDLWLPIPLAPEGN